MFTANIHHQIGEWFCYNFAAGSFYTKKLCSRLIRLNVNFIHKNDKFAL